MAVKSGLINFIKDKLRGWLDEGKQEEWNLKPSYLPMIPLEQRKYAQDVFVNLKWFENYVPGIHEQYMATGTGNDIITTAGEYIAGKPADIDVLSGPDQESDEELSTLLTNALEADDYDSKLVKVVELAAAGGGAALKIDIINEQLRIRVKGQDEFFIERDAFGEVVAFNFFGLVHREHNNFYFLVEKRQRLTNADGLSGGFVSYHLIKIAAEKAKEIGLDGAPKEVLSYIERSGIELNNPQAIGSKDLGCVYLPNTPTNTKYPKLELGESDLEQTHDVLLAADLAFTVYVRELEKTKTRMMIDERMTRKTRDVDGRTETLFDVDEDFFLQLRMPGVTDDKSFTQFIQGAFRDGSYRETMEYFIQKAVSKAGYNPATFNLGNRDVKAAEIWSIQDATTRKIEKKKRLMQRRLESFLHEYLYLLLKLQSKTLPDDVVISHEFGDPTTMNVANLASTLGALKTSESISVKERVKMLHPDWTETQIDEEVALIYIESDIGEWADPTAVAGPNSIGG